MDPRGLTKSANDWLYSMQGIVAAQEALTPYGYPGLLVCGPGPGFSRPAQALRIHGGGDHRIRTWEERGKTYSSGWPAWMVKTFCF